MVAWAFVKIFDSLVPGIIGYLFWKEFVKLQLYNPVSGTDAISTVI